MDWVKQAIGGGGSGEEETIEKEGEEPTEEMAALADPNANSSAANAANAANAAAAANAATDGSQVALLVEVNNAEEAEAAAAAAVAAEAGLGIILNDNEGANEGANDVAASAGGEPPAPPSDAHEHPHDAHPEHHPEHDEHEPLSEEQTNAALDALQEASTMMMIQTSTTDTTATATSGPPGESGGTIEGGGGEEADMSDTLMKPEQEEEDKKRKDPPPADDDVQGGGGSEEGAPNGNGNGSSKRRRSTPTRVSWDDRIKMLAAYRKEHGDLLIPIRYKINPSLGKFVHNTREQYKLYHRQTPEGYKKKCSLTAERIAQLDALGFVWSTERTKKQNEDWNARLDQLVEYKKDHGDCLVPHGYEKDASFAEWVHRQRTTYALYRKDAAEDEKKKNPMIEDRIQKLEEIGFNFRVHVDKWTEHYEQLRDYKGQAGHCLVPTHYASNPKLGRWVHTQRHQHRLMLKGRKSSMTPSRVGALEVLGFSWEVRPSLERPRASWQQRFTEVADFTKQHGNFLIPTESNPALHAWCQEQKQRLKYLDKNNGRDTTKRMGPERAKALADIGFTKDVDLADAHVAYKETHDPEDDDDHSSSEHPHDDDDHDDEDEEMKDAEQGGGAAAAAAECKGPDENAAKKADGGKDEKNAAAKSEANDPAKGVQSVSV